MLASKFEVTYIKNTSLKVKGQEIGQFTCLKYLSQISYFYETNHLVC
jgi:hypothetical protein